jgi:hypothetical protein
VRLDDPHPNGSTGMTEAILALRYNPAVLSVSAADITLGSIPAASAGWQLTSVVDQATGRIGIQLYRTTPIGAAEAGSLVHIAFHLAVDIGAPGWLTPRRSAVVQLVSSLVVSGQDFVTQVDDDQGQLVLSPGVDWLMLPSGLHSRRRPRNTFLA